MSYDVLPFGVRFRKDLASEWEHDGQSASEADAIERANDLLERGAAVVEVFERGTFYVLYTNAKD